MRKYITSLLLLILLSGNVSKLLTKDIIILSNNKQQSIDTSVKASSEPLNGYYDLRALNIVLPPNWYLDTDNKFKYNFIDDKGNNKGWVLLLKYEENFDFSRVKPNHSSIIYTEHIDIPIGECILFTLDADNGTAASGITGTHNDYYAVVTIKDKVIYLLEFSQNDKNAQTKEQFIQILKSLSFR